MIKLFTGTFTFMALAPGQEIPPAVSPDPRKGEVLLAHFDR
jgi:hypothetical protein